jgi:dipeptidyl aminopeptidase/acylaminoacyl peptidase
MRVFFLQALFFTATISAYSQKSSNSQNTTIHSNGKNQWDLNSYVWSHTHYQTGKNDKPIIDFDAIDNWEGLSKYVGISDNGRYFAYSTIKGAGLSFPQPDSLIVQSTNSSWRKLFSGIEKGIFSKDSKQYIFLDKEKLCFLRLGSDLIQSVDGVSSWKVPFNKKNEWLAYELKDSAKTVVLQSLTSKKKETFDSVSNYYFDNSCKWLTCQRSNKAKEVKLYNLQSGLKMQFINVESCAIDKEGKSLCYKNTNGSLNFINLATGKTTVIWQSSPYQTINQFKLDNNGGQVVFSIEDSDDRVSIWYWKEGMGKALQFIENQLNYLIVQPSVSFTDNGDNIRFLLKPEQQAQVPMEESAQVDVWSSQDKVLQSTQRHQLKEAKPFSAIINIETEKVSFQESEEEELYLLQGDYAIVKKRGTKLHGDRFWEQGFYEDSNWVVSLKDGRRQLLPTWGGNGSMWFTPSGKFLVYCDAGKGCHYFSYELKNGKIVDISANVPDGQFGYIDPYLKTNEKPSRGFGKIAAWLEGDRQILVYDNEDIWLLDLTGEKKAVNLTNGYGALNKIMFSLMVSTRDGGYATPLIKKDEPLLLTAFNERTKYNGYYQVRFDKLYSNPELLYMGPCFMQSPGAREGLVFDKRLYHPIKASQANAWIVHRETATAAPNYFLTKDFKNYKRLTNLEPQKKYNWMTAEFISFPQLDGTMSQAVLYKPENFDPSKKYPIIISFYGQLSDRLYQYLEPAYIDAPENYDSPSWMVSHGYLVLVPDIYFTKSEWGPSTVNTIDGAAKYLKTLAYVDSSHLGAVGHSNSGRFGYYLLTHSNSFAAMSIGSGSTGTDVISLGLSIDKENGESNLSWAERDAYGAGGLGNLWDNKSRWIDHDAVIQADKANAPLLLFHNNMDGDEVRAAVELYLAFRRLGKPIWWLQYDRGYHTLIELSDKRDFTIRYTQFFDHFLRLSPMPKWMSRGLSFKSKEVENGYELDITK